MTTNGHVEQLYPDDYDYDKEKPLHKDTGVKYRDLPEIPKRYNDHTRASVVYFHLKIFLAQYKYPPNLKELAERVGVSLNTIHRRLQQLEEYGYVESWAGRRTISVNSAKVTFDD